MGTVTATSMALVLGTGMGGGCTLTYGMMVTVRGAEEAAASLMEMGTEVVMATKVLRWARVILPLIPIKDNLRMTLSMHIISSYRTRGDGTYHGNAMGDGGGAGRYIPTPYCANGNGDGYGESGFVDGDGYCDNY